MSMATCRVETVCWFSAIFYFTTIFNMLNLLIIQSCKDSIANKLNLRKNLAIIAGIAVAIAAIQVYFKCCEIIYYSYDHNAIKNLLLLQ